MRICQPCMEGGCVSVDVQYWKRMMSKVFNSSNNTNIVVEVPLQIFFFSLWTFVSKTIKYFSLERTLQIWVLRLLFLESVSSSRIIQYGICFWVEQKRQHGSTYLIFLVRWKELHKNWILEMKRNKRPFIILPFDKTNAPKPTLQTPSFQTVEISEFSLLAKTSLFLWGNFFFCA